MIHAVSVVRDTYLDSVIQLAGTRAMRQVDGVDWATAAMATGANLETLTQEGFAAREWAGAGANDLVIAVRAESDEAVDAARKAGDLAMFAERGGPAESGADQRPVRSLREALEREPDADVAVVSVPGDYAALAAHQALTSGLHVLLFSDNVPVADEVALKQRANELGLLVMGPGAGTAMLGRTCLGFANVTSPGPVAVVAAAGTGAQEAMSLLDRWGVGVSHVIGLGGRDMSAAVGGLMAGSALAALAADERTDLVLLVSKPPDPQVAREVLRAAAGTRVVATLIGLTEELDLPDGVFVADTLETGALRAMHELGRPAPSLTDGLERRVAEVSAGLAPDRTLVRGLFSGGTLCYESLVILGRVLGPVHSNTPLRPELGLPAPPHSHQCLDLGEEEYTRGRPHPMIDPEARIEHLHRHAEDPEVAAIVLDVVLGHGSHPDPAAELAPLCARITADGGPAVVVYVLGTEGDPQGWSAQRRAFTDAGCVVTETAARASLAAAAIARREPALAVIAL